MRHLLSAALLLAVLAGCASAPPSASIMGGGYYRPSWKVRNCLSTRERLLIDRCVVVRSADGCEILGVVACPDDYAWAISEGDVDAEHVVPFAWIYRAIEEVEGKPPSKRRARRIFNDPRNLLLTHYSTNRSKGDRSPAQWCPETPKGRRLAARVWRDVVGWLGLEAALSYEDRAALEAWSRGACN